MTNIDARLVGFGINPKYMSENEKINKVYDKGFEKGFQFALICALNSIKEIQSNVNKISKGELLC